VYVWDRKASRLMMNRGFLLLSVFAAYAAAATAPHDVPSGNTSTFSVKSIDATPIAVECAGAGPTLLLVHGGTGDRSRWKPLFPLFATHFTVCAMDRRGHGASGDSRDYSLRKEAEDVAAVVNSRPGKVFVLGHSYGAVSSLEAAFLTKNIAKLVLYEPPVRERDHTAVANKMEELLRAGQKEQATVVFMQEIVMLSPTEVTRMRERSSWQGLVASIDTSLRQIRALNSYHFERKRMHTIQIPTLLLTGSETSSPDLKEAIQALRGSLPHSQLFVLKGQQHNAMDTVPEKFANAVTAFLLGDRAGLQHRK
jgi:pimeloyl-ACP methyl ester carboxylesterase